MQKAFVAHLEERLLDPWIFWATANQKGTRKTWEQQLLKALGVKPGVPDLFVLGPGPTLIGVEMKAPPKLLQNGIIKSRARPRLSEDQSLMRGKLELCDATYIVVNDLDLGLMALAMLGAPILGVPMETLRSRPPLAS